MQNNHHFADDIFILISYSIKMWQKLVLECPTDNKSAIDSLIHISVNSIKEIHTSTA